MGSFQGNGPGQKINQPSGREILATKRGDPEKPKPGFTRALAHAVAQTPPHRAIIAILLDTLVCTLVPKICRPPETLVTTQP